MRLTGLLLVFAELAGAIDFSQYVDLFYGTDGGGNMFPGVVAAPFASVKLGPDVVWGNREAYSGYLPEGNITGFSMMHESGTGGAPKYGVVSQMPTLGPVSDPLSDHSRSRARPDEASVGYYRTVLVDNITVELGGSDHAALYRYSFPLGSQGSVVVDVSHVLKSFRGTGWSQSFTSGSLDIVSRDRYEGSGTYRGGWNLAPDWTIHFCGYFDQMPSHFSMFAASTSNQSTGSLSSALKVNGSSQVGAVFTFDEAVVQSRVGISFVSRQQACDYVNAEIPVNSTISDLITQAKDRWNTEVFQKVTAPNATDGLLARLYTNLYGMHLLPSNRTGDNAKWESQEPYYDDIFTFWDLFRCTTPLYHILQPKMYEGLLRSIIDVWRHEIYMPDARSSNYNGRSQGGSNADNILADAYVKGVRGKVKWDDAYQAMLKDAEVTPPPNNDKSAPDSSTKEGRGALPDWLTLGWITPKYTRAVSRALEYSANDFGLHSVAEGLGKKKDARKYLRRSRNWRHHFNPEVKSYNITGFVVPRKADGQFVNQDPTECGGCYWGEAYYEGKPWEYSVNAHHDLAWLIRQGGGPVKFENRLDILLDPSKDLYDPGNEPSFATPYLYNFVNKQDSSVRQSRRIAEQFYGNGTKGLPGNSDAGAMQSWLLWQMIGLYPLTGQTTFLIGSPWFRDLSISLQDGKTLHISTNGPEHAIYVKSVKVNGKPWAQNWLVYDDVFANGGTMEFELAAEPTGWDKNGIPPPSPASIKHSPKDMGSKDAIETGVVRSYGHMLAYRPIAGVAWKAGVIAGCLFVAFVSCIGAIALLRRRRRRRQNQETNQSKDDDSIVCSASASSDHTVSAYSEKTS